MLFYTILHYNILYKVFITSNTQPTVAVSFSKQSQVVVGNQHQKPVQRDFSLKMKRAHFQKLPIEPLMYTHYNLSAFYLTSCISIETNFFANTRLGNHRAEQLELQHYWWRRANGSKKSN